ncbi:MAG: 7-cyano-7-deazaguanine synthase QueC [Thermoleophilia bacterium]
MTNKTICVLSGGMDSTTLLYQLLREGDQVLAISFNYGQRHRKELEYAARTCARLGVEHRTTDISNIGKLFDGNALTSAGIDIPEGHYEDNSMRLTVVPNRNMIMMAIAAGFAISRGCDRLAVAVHAGDHAIYPDCRPDFIELFEKTMKSGNYEPVSLYAPFLSWTKTEIARLGQELGINYDEETWSCYQGGAEPCGKCGTCVERAEALAAASKQR